MRLFWSKSFTGFVQKGKDPPLSSENSRSVLFKNFRFVKRKRKQNIAFVILKKFSLDIPARSDSSRQGGDPEAEYGENTSMK